MGERISSADISVLRKYDGTSTRYTELPDAERAAYVRIHEWLKATGDAILDRDDNRSKFEAFVTAGFTPSSGVRGYRPKDLWIGIYPRKHDQSPNEPQFFIIVSSRGIEIGWGASTHRSHMSNQALIKARQAYAPILFAELPDPDSPLVSKIASDLSSSEHDWYFRRMGRLQPDQNDFDSLAALITFLKSPQGIKHAAGTVAYYVSADDLDDPALDLTQQAINAFEILKPLVDIAPARTKEKGLPVNEGLEKLKVDFLRQFPGFTTFADSREFSEHERKYKDELVERFQKKFYQPLGQLEPANAEQQINLFEGLKSCLNGTLKTLGGPQNLMGWRYVDAVVQLNDSDRNKLVVDCSKLLSPEPPSPDRVEQFSEQLAQLLEPYKTRSSPGLERSFISFLLMLAYPDDCIYLRTRLYNRAYNRIHGSNLFTQRHMGAQDYGRAIEFGELLRTAAKSWGWEPRDLIDVQSFLWAAMEYDPTADDSSAEDTDSAGTEKRYWIEKTIVSGRPDREQGPHRLGAALWSPQKDKRGADIYKNMREVTPGDVVIHLTDNRHISGVSIAAEAVDDTFLGIEDTEWKEQPSYRVALNDFIRAEPSYSREQFLRNEPTASVLRTIYENEGGKGLFY